MIINNNLEKKLKQNFLKLECVFFLYIFLNIKLNNIKEICIYDMCKALSHDIKITDTCLISKTKEEVTS